MSRADDEYAGFVLRCHGLGIKPMSQDDYEKFVYKIPDPVPNVMPKNGTQKKDKLK